MIKESLKLGEPVIIGRKTSSYHDETVRQKILGIANRYVVLNISCKVIAKTVKEELKYSKPISPSYVSRILRSSGYSFKTAKKFGQKENRAHSREQLRNSGKCILEHLIGKGIPVWFDVVKFRLGSSHSR